MDVLVTKYEGNEFVDWKSTIMVLGMKVSIPEEIQDWLIETVVKDSALKVARADADDSSY